MAWLDDRIRDHPKIRNTTGNGFKWWALCLCYCNTHGTGGHLNDAVKHLGVPTKYVQELVRIGLWDDEPDGLWVHDWQEHNQKRDDAIEERRKQDRERQRAHRAKIRAERSRDVTATDAVTENVTADKTSRDTHRDGPRGRAPARDAPAPAPPRDHDQEEELKAAAGSADPRDTSPARATPNPDEHAAAAEDEKLEEQLEQLAVPGSLRQAARAEPERAKAVAAYTVANGGGGAYFRTVFESGDWPAVQANGTPVTVDPATRRRSFLEANGYRLPDDELEFQLREMGADVDELTSLVERAYELRAPS